MRFIITRNQDFLLMLMTRRKQKFVEILTKTVLSGTTIQSGFDKFYIT